MAACLARAVGSSRFLLRVKEGCEARWAGALDCYEPGARPELVPPQCLCVGSLLDI